MPRPRKPTVAALRALGRRDPALGRAIRRVPPYPGFPQPTPLIDSHFAALGRSIVYQQLAGKAAAAIHGRVCALTDGDGFPEPAEVADLGHDRLRAAGLSGSKARAIGDLADRVLDGRLRLEGIERLPGPRVIERLVQVWGVGEWSAQMFLMFRLGRLDVMAATDLGVREGLRRLDGLEERPSPAELLERSAAWAPLRSVACWVLWRLTEEE